MDYSLRFNEIHFQSNWKSFSRYARRSRNKSSNSYRYNMKNVPRVRWNLTTSYILSLAIAQDALIKELTSQLARVEPLSRTGQAVALHFLTREAADEEKRAVEQDMSRLQEVIKEKDSVIDKKTKSIAELEQSGPFTLLFFGSEAYSGHHYSPGRHSRA